MPALFQILRTSFSMLFLSSFVGLFMLNYNISIFVNIILIIMLISFLCLKIFDESKIGNSNSILPVSLVKNTDKIICFSTLYNGTVSVIYKNSTVYVICCQ